MKNVSTKVFLVLCLASPAAMAQMVSLDTLKTKGAVKLTAEQLRASAEGARVNYVAQNRWNLSWKNEAGGKLSASGNPPAGAPPEERGRYGKGTWSIQDDGQYCVEIARPKAPEKWCRFIYKAGNKFYSTVETDGKAYEIKFRLDKSKKK
jgi:Protein of unknown function (DUF995)